MIKVKRRCGWMGDDLMITYHDEEWGTPLHDDNKLFEFLVLDGAQAGLSWRTILNKRQGYRKAFAKFDPKKVAKFNSNSVKKLLKNDQIVRNRLKIESAVKNAKAFLKIQNEFGSFDKYIWNFVGGKPIINKLKTLKEIPCRTEISDRMSKDLKMRGFSFVGTTIIYAFMQAAGLVNDHTIGCFRYRELILKYKD